MCTSGCLTKDHSSWGECARSKSLRVAYCRSAVNERNDYTADKRWTKELNSYASVRKQGIQPDTTKMEDIRRAEDLSNKAGVAYGVWE